MERADLDDAFSEWAASLTSDQRAALVRWQADNDGYTQIQHQLREPGLSYDERLDRLIESLVTSILAGRLPEELTAWRGVRSCGDTFRLSAEALPSLIGTTRVFEGFLSVSTDEGLVREEFLRPSGDGGPALMVLDVGAGARAAWLPLGGWSGQADECELLLLPGRRILTTAVTFEGDLPILRGEVI